MKLSNAGATLGLVCLLYAAFAPSVAEGCRSGWTPGQRQRHCYKLFREPQGWSRAGQTCLDNRAQLAMIKAQPVQDDVDYIARQSGINSREKYWIGAVGNKRQPGAGNTYSWIDGSPLRYTHWGGNEPNNQGKNEHCVNNDHSKGSDGGGGRWNDDECHKKLPFLCAYEI